MKKRLDLIAIALTVAVMSLLVAIPVFGHDATSTNIRLVSTDDFDTNISYISNATNAEAVTDLGILVHHPAESGSVNVNVVVTTPDDKVTVQLTESDDAHFEGQIMVVLDASELDVAAAGIATISEDLTISESEISFSTAHGLATNDRIRIGAEVMLVTDINATDSVDVDRGAAGTTRTAHTMGASVDQIDDNKVVSEGDGDTITARYTITGTTTINDAVTVDGNGPSISNVSPSEEAFTSSVNQTFSARVTDNRSGMGEDEDDVQANVRFDISGVGTLNPTDVDPVSSGVWAASVQVGVDENDSPYDWFIEAFDQVGNRSVLDERELNVDQSPPTLDQATTGIGWDSEEETLTRNVRNSIMVIFTDGSTTDPEILNGSSLSASDFDVDGHVVESITYPNIPDGEDADLQEFGSGVGDETRHIVFLTLRDNLAADETPEIVVPSGSIEDRAGNDNNTQVLVEADVNDGLGPTFTVVITPNPSGSRPIAVGDEDNPIELDIRSDEDLQDDPTVYFLVLDASGTDDDVDMIVTSIAHQAAAGVVSDNRWELEREEVCPSGTSCLLAVFVVGGDDADNFSGSGGVDTADEDTLVPAPGDIVDLTKVLLVEFDDALALDGDPRVAPAKDAAGLETESMNPFIFIDFLEGNEFTVQDDDTEDVNSHSGVRLDAHPTVTITSITLNGVNVSGNVGAQSGGSRFVLATSGLAVGTHTLVFSAVDGAGNELEDEEFEFEVLERGDYEIDLTPGWNLMSFPSTPANSDIDEVFPEDHPASSILSYQNGQWLIAARGSNGQWEGTLSDIIGTAAYWVQTDAFTPVSTPINQLDPASGLPEIPVRAGWNLIPVIDLGLAGQGEFPGDDGTVPGYEVTVLDYFASINWSVAYRYNPTSGGWVRITPSTTGDNAEVRNGMAFWVWATRDGALAP